MEIGLFIIGLAIGSFLNVAATRYRSNEWLFQKSLIGRSSCSACGHQLSWFELVPIVSFLFQRGRCRSCGTRLSFQYPVSELLTGLIFVSIPKITALFYYQPPLILIAFWLAVFLILLLVSLIDWRQYLIPDEAVILLGSLGILITMFSFRSAIDFWGTSFLKNYALIFGYLSNPWLNRSAALIFSLVFFGLLVFVGRGKIMGFGDLKLALALALIFGWPDILAATAFGFIIGAVFGLIAILFKRKARKSYLPLAPFLAGGSFLLFAFGYQIIDFYFKLLLG